MNDEDLDNQTVFQMTQLIYTQMKARWDENYIGDKTALLKFQLETLEPLYPSKRDSSNEEMNTEQVSDSNGQRQRGLNGGNFEQGSGAGSCSNDQNTSAESTTEIKKYSIKQLCINLGVGNFLCWKSSPPDPVYQDLGLSVCLYLKFMKHLVLTMFILAVLPVMQIVFFYSIAQSNNFDPSSNYQKTLFAMTVGSLSLEGMKCAHQTLSKAGSYSFELVCPVGNVRVLGPVYSSNKVVSLRSCKEDINNFLDAGKFSLPQSQFTYNTNCNNELSTCTYNMSLGSEGQFTDLSVTFECINGKSKFGGTNLSRSTALICSIIFDLTFIVCMVLFYWSQTRAETKEKQYFKAKQLMLNEFTLEVGYFSKEDFDSEFRRFISDLQGLMKRQTKVDKEFWREIVQVRLPDNRDFFLTFEKKQKIYQKLYKLIGEYFIDKRRDVASFKDLNDFISFGFDFDYEIDKYKKKLIPLLKKYAKLHREKLQQTEQQINIFIVFSKPKYKRLILQQTETKGGARYLQFDQGSGKKYYVKQTLAPALVAWDNMNKTGKVWRNVVSWIITVLLIAATYVLIAFMLWQRDKLLKNYDFNLECKTLYPNNSYSSFDQSLSQQNPNGYTHCYCISKSAFVFINNDPNCSTWTWQYTLYLLIPIIFSVVIVIINTIISAIYKALSQFQAHAYLTSELYSYIIKKSLLLILNMALIIIVLSIDTKAGNTQGDFNFLLQGQYNDITADWYLEVGLFIMLTLIFNTFSPCVQSVVFFVLSIVTKVLISSFKKKPSHFKLKANYMEFYRGDILPIEERYAYIIALLAITFCLNFVFPILTLILLVTMFLLQLNDKILIIKGFQKPINFGNQLHSKFIKSLIIILLIHLAITSVLITEPFLLVAGIPSLDGSIAQVNRNRFCAFFETGYVIPYALLFIMILVSFCVGFGAELYAKTKPNEKVCLGLDGIPYEQHKFYHLVKKYELRRTLALKKRQIVWIKWLEKLQSNKQPEVKLYSEFNPPPALESSTNINVKEQQIQRANENIQSHKQKSILLQIAQLNLQKIQNRLKQDVSDKQTIVKLNGMTVYDWYKDWVFFDEHFVPNFQVPGLNKLIQNGLPAQTNTGLKGKIFNYFS